MGWYNVWSSPARPELSLPFILLFKQLVLLSSTKMSLSPKLRFAPQNWRSRNFGPAVCSVDSLGTHKTVDYRTPLISWMRISRADNGCLSQALRGILRLAKDGSAAVGGSINWFSHHESECGGSSKSVKKGVSCGGATFNTSTQEVEAGRCLQVQGQ